MTSHERHGVQNSRQLDCLFYSLFRLAIKETSKFHTTGPLWQPVVSPHQWSLLQKVVPCHEVTSHVIMGCCTKSSLSVRENVYWQLKRLDARRSADRHLNAKKRYYMEYGIWQQKRWDVLGIVIHHITTHLLSIERADWLKLHDMLNARAAKSWQR